MCIFFIPRGEFSYFETQNGVCSGPRGPETCSTWSTMSYLITEKNLNKKYFFIMEKNDFRKNENFKKHENFEKSENDDFK